MRVNSPTASVFETEVARLGDRNRSQTHNKVMCTKPNLRVVKRG